MNKTGTNNIDTPQYWARLKYSWIRQRILKSPAYRDVKILFSIKELEDWVKMNWKKIKDMKLKGDLPTIDRIDPKGHYDISNIQVLSFPENVSKNSALSVKATNILTGEVKFFYPISKVVEAGFIRGKVYAALKGRQSHHKGYIWEYVHKKE